MRTISSKQNPLVKRIREAIREHADEIVVEGPKAVADAIANGWKPIHVLERGVHVTEAVFDAISENRWRWRDTTRAKTLFGWQPTGRSDDFDLGSGC